MSGSGVREGVSVIGRGKSASVARSRQSLVARGGVACPPAAPRAGDGVTARLQLSSNRREDHEVSMLALHLLQNCMIHVNTLMLQQVLAQPHWRQKLEPRDLTALTPLIWEHVNPYGRFELDMNARISLD
jgi:hypothetical protein